MSTPQPVTLKITLPKIPDIELVAIEGLNRLGAHLGIAEDKLGEARIIVTEAIVNAMEHAGGGDGVLVEFTVTPEQLVIFVRDYGTGFDVTAVPDTAARRAAGDRRGWGLKLMKSMSDDFRLESTNKGTVITLMKKLT